MSGTSSKSAMSSKLQLAEIDDLQREDHWYLTADDHCFFVREYLAGVGYQGGATNSLISNLKKSLDRRGKPGWHYKGLAIRQAAAELREALASSDVSEMTMVPMPPSKARTDPLYDDRMTQVARLICKETGIEMRELLLQTNSRQSFHQSDLKRDVAGLIQHFTIDDAVATPPPKYIFVLDDLLTTGAHFRAAKAVLQRRFGPVLVVGLFVARRIPRKEDVPDQTDDKT